MSEHEPAARDIRNWAKPVSTLTTTDVPDEALNLNVDGRRVMGPLQGFGKLWQKTYQASLGSKATTPAEAISAWKEHFGQFWPEKSCSTRR